MNSIYDYVTIASGIIMSILILMQTRGAGLGAGFGGSAEINTVRRGSDKTLFQLTIIFAVIFVFSIILGIVLG
ncbi:preprotein translocase subunit SecG [Candidatus Saccharibacteria bacterium]|nr:preprotein translocase subunit SecG [Candidatus Saccharibacteria bacterium]MDQ5953867.1 preprotein translocase subunit SecG [Patescibacteria group bacterium]MDQ5958747.1 preprotein translocase subunit SecG [Patescibacteria group bacterium]